MGVVQHHPRNNTCSIEATRLRCCRCFFKPVAALDAGFFPFSNCFAFAVTAFTVAIIWGFCFFATGRYLLSSRGRSCHRNL